MRHLQLPKPSGGDRAGFLSLDRPLRFCDMHPAILGHGKRDRLGQVCGEDPLVKVGRGELGFWWTGRRTLGSPKIRHEKQQESRTSSQTPQAIAHENAGEQAGSRLILPRELWREGREGR